MTQIFGRKLRELRRTRGWTQAELAGHLDNMTQSFISYLESGQKDPSIDVAIQIADLFDVTLDYLLRDAVPIKREVHIRGSSKETT